MPRYNSLGEALGGALQGFAPVYLDYKLGQRDRQDRRDRENQTMDRYMTEQALAGEQADRRAQEKSLADRLAYERDDRNRMMDFETEQMKLRNRPEAQLSETEVIGKYLQDNPGVLESLLGARINKMNERPNPPRGRQVPDVVRSGVSQFGQQYNRNPENWRSTKKPASADEAGRFFDTQIAPRIPAMQREWPESFGQNAPDSLRGGLMNALGYGQAPNVPLGGGADTTRYPGASPVPLGGRFSGIGDLKRDEYAPQFDPSIEELIAEKHRRMQGR